MQHTPGPWTITDREIRGPQDSGVIVARLPEWGILADGPDPAPANARLIAAAPALLDALEELLSEVTANTYPKALAELGAIGRASAAIAAAKGEA